MEPEESIARAVATAGSAVVFAGLTVMIALGGLAVARIPFLTTMGVAAAVGVAIAVLIALTLLPALLGFAGEKLRPKAQDAGQLDRLSRARPVDMRRAAKPPRPSEAGAGPAVGPAGDRGAGADRRARGGGPGGHGLPGQGPADRPAQQRDG